MTGRAWGAVLALVALAGCEPGSIEDLSRPAIGVVIVEGGGFCSSLSAVDGDGAVWHAHGCGSEEGAMRRRDRTVSAAERADLDAMMDEVIALADDPECDLVSPSDRSYRFVRTTDGAEPESTRQCGSGVPPVARRLADRLEALAAPPDPDASTAADAG